MALHFAPLTSQQKAFVAIAMVSAMLGMCALIAVSSNPSGVETELFGNAHINPTYASEPGNVGYGTTWFKWQNTLPSVQAADMVEGNPWEEFDGPEDVTGGYHNRGRSLSH